MHRPLREEKHPGNVELSPAAIVDLLPKAAQRTRSPDQAIAYLSQIIRKIRDDSHPQQFSASALEAYLPTILSSIKAIIQAHPSLDTHAAWYAALHPTLLHLSSVLKKRLKLLDRTILYGFAKRESQAMTALDISNNTKIIQIYDGTLINRDSYNTMVNFRTQMNADLTALFTYSRSTLSLDSTDASSACQATSLQNIRRIQRYLRVNYLRLLSLASEEASLNYWIFLHTCAIYRAQDPAQALCTLLQNLASTSNIKLPKRVFIRRKRSDLAKDIIKRLWKNNNRWLDPTLQRTAANKLIESIIRQTYPQLLSATNLKALLPLHAWHQFNSIQSASKDWRISSGYYRLPWRYFPHHRISPWIAHLEPPTETVVHDFARHIHSALEADYLGIKALKYTKREALSLSERAWEIVKPLLLLVPHAYGILDSVSHLFHFANFAQSDALEHTLHVKHHLAWFIEDALELTHGIRGAHHHNQAESYLALVSVYGYSASIRGRSVNTILKRFTHHFNDLNDFQRKSRTLAKLLAMVLKTQLDAIPAEHQLPYINYLVKRIRYTLYLMPASRGNTPEQFSEMVLINMTRFSMPEKLFRRGVRSFLTSNFTGPTLPLSTHETSAFCLFSAARLQCRLAIEDEKSTTNESVYFSVRPTYLQASIVQNHQYDETLPERMATLQEVTLLRRYVQHQRAEEEPFNIPCDIQGFTICIRQCTLSDAVIFSERLTPCFDPYEVSVEMDSYELHVCVTRFQARQDSMNNRLTQAEHQLHTLSEEVRHLRARQNNLQIQMAEKDQQINSLKRENMQMKERMAEKDQKTEQRLAQLEQRMGTNTTQKTQPVPVSPILGQRSSSPLTFFPPPSPACNPASHHPEARPVENPSHPTEYRST